ncbi:MAG: alpha/beta hydrolase [Clostridia bacterium]|nr:alpha/beta hydrolase [Clostridia bacterium]
MWIVFMILALLIVLSAALIIARWAFGQAFAPPRGIDPLALPEGEQYQRERVRMEKMIAEMAAIPYTEIRMTARDGTPLFARYYAVREGAPLQIQMHGYHGSAIRDFCGGGKLAIEAGHNILIVDQRAQGQSGGRAITFGVLERFDCLDWINYANDRFAPPCILLYGVSMGAATVLMANGLDLPANVRAVVADCPYSAPYAIIARVCGERGIPQKLAMPFVRLGGILWGGFDLCSAAPVESVMSAKVPMLIFHGEDDRFVPCEMSREIARHAGNHCRLETFPNAGHGLSFIEDFPRYAAAIEQFLADCGVETQKTT